MSHNECDSKCHHTVFSLHMAAHYGDLVRLREEIVTNPDKIDERCYFGATALHYAASANRPDAVRVLLEYGADPFAYWQMPPCIPMPSQEKSPMTVALSNSSTACAQLFLQHADEKDAQTYEDEMRKAKMSFRPALRAMHNAHVPTDIRRVIWDMHNPPRRLHHFLRHTLDNPKVNRAHPTLDGIDDLMKPYVETCEAVKKLEKARRAQKKRKARETSNNSKKQEGGRDSGVDASTQHDHLSKST